MSAKKYSDEALGDLEVVEDFLPSPDEPDGLQVNYGDGLRPEDAKVYALYVGKE